MVFREPLVELQILGPNSWSSLLCIAHLCCQCSKNPKMIICHAPNVGRVPMIGKKHHTLSTLSTFPQKNLIWLTDKMNGTGSGSRNLIPWSLLCQILPWQFFPFQVEKRLVPCCPCRAPSSALCWQHHWKRTLVPNYLYQRANDWQGSNDKVDKVWEKVWPCLVFFHWPRTCKLCLFFVYILRRANRHPLLLSTHGGSIGAHKLLCLNYDCVDSKAWLGWWQPADGGRPSSAARLDARARTCSASLSQAVSVGFMRLTGPSLERNTTWPTVNCMLLFFLSVCTRMVHVFLVPRSLYNKP